MWQIVGTVAAMAMVMLGVLAATTWCVALLVRHLSESLSTAFQTLTYPGDVQQANPLEQEMMMTPPWETWEETEDGRPLR